MSFLICHQISISSQFSFSKKNDPTTDRNRIISPIFSILKTVVIILLFSTCSCTSSPEAFEEEYTQPIEFSHKTHAGTNEIPCEFCHTYARRSINSGAPSVGSCVGCHSVILGSDDKQKKEVQKTIDRYTKKQPILWKKIHDIPDFVYFSHKRHIHVGYDCTECHGDIDQLDVITMDTMITDLSMGWCMTCHKTMNPTMNGKIVGPVRKTRGGPILANAVIEPHDGTLLGSTDCYTCHK